jgi:polyisoprenoid-binding protein YceI
MSCVLSRAFLLSATVLAIAAPSLAAPAVNAAVAAAPKVRRLDGASVLIVQTWKDGAAARLAHDHAILAPTFSGEVTYHAADPTQSRIVVDVDAGRLIVDDDRARAVVGLEPGVPQKDREAVDESMKGSDQLDVEHFPRIRFESTAVTQGADGALLVTGRFSLHGQTRTVQLPVTVEERADGSLRGRGTLRLKVSDYGITPYSAFLGAVKVKDEVRLHLDLIAR